jgi:hypothetical protein
MLCPSEFQTTAPLIREMRQSGKDVILAKFVESGRMTTNIGDHITNVAEEETRAGSADAGDYIEKAVQKVTLCFRTRQMNRTLNLHGIRKERDFLCRDGKSGWSFRRLVF